MKKYKSTKSTKQYKSTKTAKTAKMIKIKKNVKSTKIQKNSPAPAFSTRKAKQSKTAKVQNRKNKN